MEAYTTFAQLEAACEAFCADVNARVHRVTGRAPAEMLAEEQARLHPVPQVPHTVAFGVTRTVAAKTPMVAFDGGQYCVPAHLLGQVVWVRVHGAGAGEQVIIVHIGPAGPVEVARHGRATPGSPPPGRRALPAAAGRGIGTNPEGPQRLRGRVPAAGRRCAVMADRGRRRGHHQGPVQDG